MCQELLQADISILVNEYHRLVPKGRRENLLRDPDFDDPTKNQGQAQAYYFVKFSQ